MEENGEGDIQTHNRHSHRTPCCENFCWTPWYPMEWMDPHHSSCSMHPN